MNYYGILWCIQLWQSFICQPRLSGAKPKLKQIINTQNHDQIRTNRDVLTLNITNMFVQNINFFLNTVIDFGVNLHVWPFVYIHLCPFVYSFIWPFKILPRFAVKVQKTFIMNSVAYTDTTSIERKKNTMLFNPFRAGCLPFTSKIVWCLQM